LSQTITVAHLGATGVLSAVIGAVAAKGGTVAKALWRFVTKLRDEDSRKVAAEIRAKAEVKIAETAAQAEIEVAKLEAHAAEHVAELTGKHKAIEAETEQAKMFRAMLDDSRQENKRVQAELNLARTAFDALVTQSRDAMHAFKVEVEQTFAAMRAEIAECTRDRLAGEARERSLIRENGELRDQINDAVPR
jgi:hypothetical protein